MCARGFFVSRIDRLDHHFQIVCRFNADSRTVSDRKLFSVCFHIRNKALAFRPPPELVKLQSQADAFCRSISGDELLFVAENIHPFAVFADLQCSLACYISACGYRPSVTYIKALCRLSFNAFYGCGADYLRVVFINKSRTDIFAGKCYIGNASLNRSVVNRKKRTRSSVLTVLTHYLSFLPFSFSCAKLLLKAVLPPPEFFEAISSSSPNASLASAWDSKIFFLL